MSGRSAGGRLAPSYSLVVSVLSLSSVVVESALVLSVVSLRPVAL